MVLAASGETLWHVHAAAAARSNLPLPIASAVAIEAGTIEMVNANTTEAVEAVEAAAHGGMFTETPIFRPFVMVHIELPEDYSSGEVMAVNDAGQAVGWMHNDSETRDHAFFFDPVEGVTILNFSESIHDATWANSLTDDATPVIAGAVMWKGVPNYLRACVWEGPGGPLATKFGTSVVSSAFDVAPDGSEFALATMYVNNDHHESRVWFDGGSTSEYPASGVEGEALSINSSAEVVGWHMVSGKSHAYSWINNTTTDIHPQGWDASGANAINQYGDIAGWVEDASSGTIPAYWLNNGNFYTFATPFPSLGAESEVCAINRHGEMVVTRTDAPGAVLWQVFQSEDVSNNLSGMTLMPDAAGQIASARTINDNLWIGGSYKATSQSNAVPCLIIPYDVDNDGEPDYREIVNGIEADANGNWLIDWAEDMRVGINNPGYNPPANNKSHAIANTQVISLPMHIGNFPLDGPADEFAIEEVLSGGLSCEEFRGELEHWSRVTQDDPQEREVSMLLRSTIGGEVDFDYLPQTTNERTGLLADIKHFAYEYAWCVDYIQTGNEVFGGAGGYKFYYDAALFDCDEWPGARTFQELSAACKEEAVFLVRDWLEEQAWAALEGSALAGRPLRIVGPGIIYEHVRSAHSYQGGGGEGEVAFFILDNIVDWLNANQMHFDLHLHYRGIAEGLDAIDDLTDPQSNWGGPPNWKVSREFGPAATTGPGGWASGSNLTEFAKFRDDYTTQGPCDQNCCNEVPANGNWDAFVLDNWRFAQFNEDFQMDTFLAALASEGWAFVAYGPVHMAAPAEIVFDMAALRSNRVCDNRMHPNRSTQTRFTPLTDEFETQAANYDITFPQNRRNCPDCE